jgi:hypothetical protein
MCLTPLILKNKYTDETVQCPCSKCPECRSRRASAWSFRLRQEDKISQSSLFITLTYDTMFVPITQKKRMTLDRSDSKGHLPKFFKRLRKAHGHNDGQPLKYYAVGEYGGQSQRPHYHIILFNANIKLMVSNTDRLKLEATNYDGQTEIIIKQWSNGLRKNYSPLGHGTVGKCTPASVGYTLKYISKPKTIPMYKGDDRKPEHSTMSKLLGINYLTKSMTAWHKADILNRMYCVVEDGKKMSMPRYYKDKLYNDEQREDIKHHFYEKYVSDTIRAFQSNTYTRDREQKKAGIAAAISWNKKQTKKEKL